MKISAIETGRISAKLDSRVRAKKDLTSFGVNNNQTQPNSDIDPQKANEAIKTTFLSNVSFGGHTEQLHSMSAGTSGYYYYIDDKHKHYEEPIDAIKGSKHSHPYSYIRMTYSSNGANNVYFADPEEVVSGDISSKHCYIVYDPEPKFPSLDKIRKRYSENYTNYYSPDWESYCNRCINIYDYHERLKNADLKELLNLMKIKEQQEKELVFSEEYKQKLEQNSIDAPWERNMEILNTADYYCNTNRSRLYFTNEKIDYYRNRIENSKAQQRLATTLYSIINEAVPIFSERDRIYGKLPYTNDRVYGEVRSKEDALNVLKKTKADLSSLENKYSTTKAWQTLKRSEFEEIENKNGWCTATYREQAKKELDNLTRKLENMTEEINHLKPFIKKLEEMSVQYDIVNANHKEVLDKLAKLYPKVEAFYKENAKRMLCG